MKTLLFGILFLLSSLAACADDTIYFLGADRGVYMDAGNGLRRVGLGTGNSLAVHAGVLYLAGDDGQVWSADQRGRWLPISGTSQAKKVVVDPQGTLFILGSDGGVYRYSNGMSRRGLAVASDLAVSGNGDLYVVGTDGKCGSAGPCSVAKISGRPTICWLRARRWRLPTMALST